MKIRKNAEQKNVILNRDYYTQNELEMLLETKEIFFINKNNRVSYDLSNMTYSEKDDIVFRISTSDLEEIKVIYNKEYGSYETIAIGINGLTYHINL